jgi:flagellar biosynthesis component FlhA
MTLARKLLLITIAAGVLASAAASDATTQENKTVKQKIAEFCKKRPGLLLLGTTLGLMATATGLCIYAFSRSQSNLRVFDSNNKELWNSLQPIQVLINVLPSGPVGLDPLS